MTKFGYAAIAALSWLALGDGPAPAQGHAAEAASTPGPAEAGTQARAPLEAALDAADLGDLGPLLHALPTAHGDAAAVIRGRLALARLDPAPADPALARIADGRDPVLRVAALSILADDAFLRDAYADAARRGRALEAAQAARGDSGRARESAQQWQVAALLAAHPAQAVEGAIVSGGIAARTDRVGLPRIDVAVDGQAQEAVFDTGASLSVLSTETARRLGVTVIEGGTRVGNGVEGTVAVRLGVADRLEIAGTILRNVPFLIIDDAQLTFPVPGGYEIRAIVGLPVMRALGRVRMEPAAGRFTVLAPEDAPAAAPPNLVASAGRIFVAVSLDGHEVPLHLDTGANRSGLSALYAAANPARIVALATGREQSASAGGTASTQVATWPQAPLAFGGRTLVLPTLQIALPGAGGPAPRSYGALGSEALRAFQSYTLDFHAMRLDLGPPVPAAAAAAQ